MRDKSNITIYILKKYSTVIQYILLSTKYLSNHFFPFFKLQMYQARIWSIKISTHISLLHTPINILIYFSISHVHIYPKYANDLILLYKRVDYKVHVTDVIRMTNQWQWVIDFCCSELPLHSWRGSFCSSTPIDQNPYLYWPGLPDGHWNLSRFFSRHSKHFWWADRKYYQDGFLPLLQGFKKIYSLNRSQ